MSLAERVKGALNTTPTNTAATTAAVNADGGAAVTEEAVQFELDGMLKSGIADQDPLSGFYIKGANFDAGGTGVTGDTTGRGTVDAGTGGTGTGTDGGTASPCPEDADLKAALQKVQMQMSMVKTDPADTFHDALVAAGFDMDDVNRCECKQAAGSVQEIINGLISETSQIPDPGRSKLVTLLTKIKALLDAGTINGL